ncbi:MAG TPA: hypothetical protein P5180_06875 [Bacteroidales bacterium]|nr:hypothetical protein [Bacteroidales bacterium]
MALKLYVQEFGLNKSLTTAIYNFILDNELNIAEREAELISKKFIKRIIERFGVTINGIVTTNPNTKIEDEDIIELQQFDIKFICRENAEYEDNKPKGERLNLPAFKEEITSVKATSSENQSESSESSKSEVIKQSAHVSEPGIDATIGNLLSENFGVNAISGIPHNEFKRAFCLFLKLFQDKGHNKVYQSKYSYELTDFLKNRVNDSNLHKELTFSKQQLSSSGMLVEKLLIGKAEKENELSQLVNDLVLGQYDSNLYRFLQEYCKLINSSTFQFMLLPLFDKNLSNRVALENLIKAINDASNKPEIEEKYLHFESRKSLFENYLQNLEKSDTFNRVVFNNIYEHLWNLFKTACDAIKEKSVLINVETSSKKYNFQNAEISNHDIFIFIANNGEGLARNLTINSLSKVFSFEEITVGLLKPGERREIIINAGINYSPDFKPNLEILMQWEETSGKIKSAKANLVFELQDTDIPWDKLIKQNLYTIQIIEDKNKLYGRDEILEELKMNILSDNIVSYKIWGQKRVGKSSIVKTLKTVLNDYEDVIVVYRRIGGIRNSDPIITLNELGESLCSEVLNEIDSKVKSPQIREQLKNITVPVFNGSLYPLESFLNRLHRIERSLKFIFVLDEFDRINEEFFLPGNIGEVLSQGIGKGLNEEKYIGFLLVGSENMQILDRQGMNYNSYREREVDTFSKVTQYQSYKNIVVGPGTPYLVYSEEAIDRIYDITNGNPYFTNLICQNAFMNAYKNRDSYIDTHSTDFAVDLIVKSSQKGHFEHFWGDGLTEESDSKKERKTDIRRRILVSYSISCRQDLDHFPSKSEILRNFKYPSEYKIEAYEVENTITEFFNRKIFYESSNSIRIKPQIFERWLVSTGKTLMIEGVSDLEAQHREKELERQFALKDEEIKRLSDAYIFEGKKITIDEFKRYFKQFGNSIEQRRIFNLIDSIYYISQEEINDFFKNEQRNIFFKQVFEVKEGIRTIFREGIEIFSFSKDFEEYLPIIDSFKKMSRIRATKTVKNLVDDKDLLKKNTPTEIIIFEPILDSIIEIQAKLLEFLQNELIKDKVQVRLISLVISTKVKTGLIRNTAAFNNFKLVFLHEIEETKIKPFIEGTELFEKIDDANQVYAESRRFFPNLTKNTLLVLFEPFCPSKSCPILWCKTSQFTPLFPNMVGSCSGAENISDSEHLRLRLYTANTELSQKLNRYIIDRLKKRGELDGGKDWFNVDYIPKGVMESVSSKWIQEGQESPKESYFDFIDYKKIIEKDAFLMGVLKLPGIDLSWCEKLNKLRRDPAHPEKPAPSLDEVEYFEKVTKLIRKQIETNPL